MALHYRWGVQVSFDRACGRPHGAGVQAGKAGVQTGGEASGCATRTQGMVALGCHIRREKEKKRCTVAAGAGVPLLP